MLQDAVSLKTLGQSHKHDTPQSLDNNSDLVNRVVFIDSTWSQCQKIITVSMKLTQLKDLAWKLRNLK